MTKNYSANKKDICTLVRYNKLVSKLLTLFNRPKPKIYNLKCPNNSLVFFAESLVNHSSSISLGPLSGSYSLFPPGRGDPFSARYKWDPCWVNDESCTRCLINNNFICLCDQYIAFNGDSSDVSDVESDSIFDDYDDSWWDP